MSRLTEREEANLEMQKRDHVEKLISAAQSLAVSMKDEPRSRAALRYYMRFLLSDDFPTQRAYGDLAAFLEWYGMKYVFPRIMDVFEEVNVISTTFDKIVELGTGTGWLIRRLSRLFPKAYCWAVDKRRDLYHGDLAVHFIEGNLEDADEIADIRRRMSLTKDSLIVANQFLHCVDNPVRVIDEFASQKWLVIEVDNDPMMPQWGAQMKLFGATPLPDRDLVKAFEESGKHGLDRIWRTTMPGLVISLFDPK